MPLQETGNQLGIDLASLWLGSPFSCRCGSQILETVNSGDGPHECADCGPISATAYLESWLAFEEGPAVSADRKARATVRQQTAQKLEAGIRHRLENGDLPSSTLQRALAWHDSREERERLPPNELARLLRRLEYELFPATR